MESTVVGLFPCANLIKPHPDEDYEWISHTWSFNKLQESKFLFYMFTVLLLFVI